MSILGLIVFIICLRWIFSQGFWTGCGGGAAERVTLFCAQRLKDRPALGLTLPVNSRSS